MNVCQNAGRAGFRTYVRATAALWLVTTLGVLPLALAASPSSSRLVVVLYPEANDGSPGHALADRGIRTAFAKSAGMRISVHNEYLDVSRFPDADRQQELVRFLRRKYEGRKVDLVMTGLASALDFAITHHDELFPDAPKVFFSVDDEELKSRTLPADVVGIPIQMELKESLKIALTIHPGTEQVYVVVGKSKFDRHWELHARNVFRAFEQDLSVNYLVGLPIPELLERVARLPEHSVVYYLHVFEDGDGIIRVPADVLEQLSTASNAPVYGHVDSYIGRGIVGGKVFSFEVEGRRAAELGLKLLGGETPLRLGTQKASGNAYVFDARQLKRWGIDAKVLPAGSTIRFQQPDFWGEYKWHIVTLGAVCAVQGLLIASMVLQRKRRNRLQRQSQRELQELTGRLLVAQESERKRIARELHDDFGQNLALLSVEMDLLQQAPRKTDEQLSTRIDGMSARVKQLSTSIHELSHQLHPIKLEQLGLLTALGSLCNELSRTHRLTITFTHNGLPAHPPETSLCIYRVTQEALSNALRHSGASNVTVALSNGEGSIRLRIEDDGRGFDPTSIADREGLGLVSIRERLRACDGSLTIDAKPGHGTRLKIVIPLTDTQKGF